MPTTTTAVAGEAGRQPDVAPSGRILHLERAEDYIRTNLKNPFSLLDLTKAAGTSPSTLLRTFNTRRGLSPMQYLKRLRLQAVRRSLLAADPRIDSVGRVATEFGFRQLGRFAADYRQVYGELPSVTLRRQC